MLKRQSNDKILIIKNQIKDTYLKDDIPWIIGYSGGKDSTVVLQLVMESILELKKENKANKKIYVISSDTLVENPMVLERTVRSIDNINDYCLKNNLPIEAEVIYPKWDNTFFVNVIGRGYPVPLQSFRWCTDRIKISPANNYIYNKIDENGEVILLLGTRKEESTSRKRSMEKHEINNSILSLHSQIDNAWTYPVISDMTVNEVWSYLLKNPSPWGDNKELYGLYTSSSMDGECPLVIDSDVKDTQSCGNSRFGCWTCTVVKEDKSLTGFIQSGEEWLKPFLDYRNELIKTRDNDDKRNIFDKNGNLKLVDCVVKDGNIIIPDKLERKKEIIPTSEAITYEEAVKKIKQGYDKTIIIKRYDKYFKVGRSGYTYEYRAELLEKLLEVGIKIQEKINGYEIIRDKEIIAIDKIWKDSGYTKISAIDIYNKYSKNKLIKESSNINYDLLDELSDINKFDKNTLRQIINKSKENQNLKNRNSTMRFIDKKLKEDKLIIKGE